MTPDVFTYEVKGEDRYRACELADGSHLAVVADGHGGAHCARTVVGSIGGTIEHRFAMEVEGGRTLSEDRWIELARDALRSAIDVATHATSNELSGAVVTVVIAAGSGSPLVFAQLGDTVAFWRGQDGSFERTPDHNCRTNQAERRAAEERGGRYFLGYIMASDGSGGLQPGRSLGDHFMGDVVSKTPDIDVAYPSGAIVVSSDGILNDVQGDSSSEEALFTRLLDEIEDGAGVERAVRKVCGGRFRDDVTVVALVDR